jgi:hypothetical protein
MHDGSPRAVGGELDTQERQLFVEAASRVNPQQDEIFSQLLNNLDFEESMMAIRSVLDRKEDILGLVRTYSEAMHLAEIFLAFEKLMSSGNDQKPIAYLWFYLDEYTAGIDLERSRLGDDIARFIGNIQYDMELVRRFARESLLRAQLINEFVPESNLWKSPSLAPGILEEMLKQPHNDERFLDIFRFIAREKDWILKASTQDVENKNDFDQCCRDCLGVPGEIVKDVRLLEILVFLYFFFVGDLGNERLTADETVHDAMCEIVNYVETYIRLTHETYMLQYLNKMRGGEFLWYHFCCHL